MKFNLAILALCFCGIATAEEKAPPTVEAHLRLIAVRQPLLGAAYREGKKLEPLVLATDFFTHEITYHGPSRFEIVPYQLEKVHEADGKQDPNPQTSPVPNAQIKNPPPPVEPLAWLDLPATANPLHLILLVDQTRASGGGILAIPDTPGIFPYGSLRFFNLCPYPLEIQLHGKTTRLEPQSGVVIRSPVAEGKYYEGTMYGLKDGERRIVYNLRIFQQNEVRTMFFVTPVDGPNPEVALKGVEDRQPLISTPGKGR